MRALAILVLFAGVASADVKVVRNKIITSKIQYNYTANTVRADSFATLNALAKFLKSKPALAVIEIAVHVHPTRGDGGASALEFSQKRADSVREYLVDKADVDGTRLVAKGYGGSQPIADEDTEAAFEKNFRTEFIILERR